MIGIRSGLFFIVFVVGIVVFGILISALWPVTTLNFRRQLVCRWTDYNRLCLALICGLRDNIVGLENLPAAPYVIMAKHQSAWETTVFQSIFSPIVYLMKKSLQYIPVFGWALMATEQIFIDRSQGVRSLKKIMQDGRKQFDQGVSVIVFPEGTRTPYGEVGKYQVGGISLAMAAGVPIVPVAHNAGKFWQPSSWLQRPGVIQVRIGTPIFTAGVDKKGRKELLALVKQRIEGMVADIENS